jgi:hypothetical protein
MNDVEFVGGMLPEKITKNEFRLRLTVGLHLIIDRNIYGLIQEFGKFFGAAGFDGFLYLAYNIALPKGRTHLKTHQHQN